MAWWWAGSLRKRPGDSRRGFEPTVPSEPAGGRSRLEVCPPSLFDDDFEPTRSGLASLLPPLTTIRQWLQTGWYSTEQSARRPAPAIDAHAARGDERLRSARTAFVDALADLDNREAVALANCARAAHTLRELWHLRNALFTVVSIGHCESVAQARLAELNRHFEIREQGATMRRGWLGRLPAPARSQRPWA